MLLHYIQLQYFHRSVAFPVTTGPVPRGAFAGHAPSNKLLCPPLSILLKVIDFESEGETDKTAHIRKKLNALTSLSNWTRSLMARSPLHKLFSLWKPQICPQEQGFWTLPSLWGHSNPIIKYKHNPQSFTYKALFK